MKHKGLIRVSVLLTALCVFLCSCSYLFDTPVLPIYELETSDTTRSQGIGASQPADIDTTDTAQESVLTTDETTAIEITTESESVESNTTDTEETTDTEPDIDDIPFVKGDYASLDGYNALLSFEDGEDMQVFYKRLKAAADEIHASEDIDAYSLEISDTASVDNIIGSVPYPPSLNNEELFLVFNLFRADNPLYYWINNKIIFSSKDLYMMTVDDYADGSVRKAYNELIEAKIDEYLDAVENETSAYKKALYFHDNIIKNMNYAVGNNGVILEGLKYHNIFGAFIGGSGVCESYAKAFQLLLNASGIENCYVIGVSGTQMASGIGHVWNMIKLEDGKWYYCDLTWDDLGDEDGGVQYNNFCAGSETNINEGYVGGVITFASEHIENLPTGTGESFLYAIPVASETKYIPEE